MFTKRLIAWHLDEDGNRSYIVDIAEFDCINEHDEKNWIKIFKDRFFKQHGTSHFTLESI